MEQKHNSSGSFKPSKYKELDPTTIDNLVQHQGDKYKAPPRSLVEHLIKGTAVKVVFINKEELWVEVDKTDVVDEDHAREDEAFWTSKVYGKLLSTPKYPLKDADGHTLKKGQRVQIKMCHIVEAHDPEDDIEGDHW